MLNPEFFGSSNQILNYARIGSIIGHEITHGFDVEGQKFDKDGSLRPWSTHSNFSDYSKCFVEQYNNYYVPEIKSYVSKQLITITYWNILFKKKILTMMVQKDIFFCDIHPIYC